MRFRTGRLACVFVAVLVVAACGGDASKPAISDARVGAPTGPNAALYFTAEGYGTDDSLRGATTPSAESVALHETTMADDGTMSMESLPRLELAEAGTLILEPGGFHLMLVDVNEDLEIGSSIEVTLEWAVAGAQAIEATVVDPSDTMGETG